MKTFGTFFWSMMGMLVFVFSACQSGRDIPAWVEEAPLEADYYVGIGWAEKTAGEDGCRQQAENMALDQITEDIVAASSGAVSDEVLDQAGIDRVTFFEHFTLKTRERIEDFEYEKVEEYESEGEFWAFYRLSMEEYGNKLDEMIQAARDNSWEYYQHSEELMFEGDLSMSLAYALRAAGEIAPYWGMGISAPDEERREKLDALVRDHLHNLLRGMRLRAIPNTLELHVEEAPEVPIGIEVQYSGIATEIRPVKELPLAVEVEENVMEYSPPQPTNLQGESRLEIGVVLKEGYHEVNILPDVKRMGDLHQETLSAPLFQSVTIPYARLMLRVSGY